MSERNLTPAEASAILFQDWRIRPSPSKQYATIEPLTFAGAVMLLIRGRSARKEALRRWRRKLGDRFPADLEQKLLAATQEVLDSIASGRVKTWGTPCDGDGNVEDERTIDLRFLQNGVFADPLAEIEVQSDWMAEDGFGRQNCGYKSVRLNRAQFLEAIKVQRNVPRPEGAATGATGAIQGCAQTTEPVATGAPGRPTSMHLVEAELERRIAAGNTWPSKTSAAEELSEWLRLEHEHAPRLTPKTISNKLGSKIPISSWR